MQPKRHKGLTLALTPRLLEAILTDIALALPLPTSCIIDICALDKGNSHVVCVKIPPEP